MGRIDSIAAKWDAMEPRLAPLIKHWGFVVAAEVAGIPKQDYRAMCEAMRKRGHRHGRKIGCRTPEQRADEVRAAKAWEAAGRPSRGACAPQIKLRNRLQRMEFGSRHLPQPLQLQTRPAAAPLRQAHTVVHPDGVRHTVAPTPGSRHAPDPGYVGPFSRTAPGIDPLTNEAWS